MKTFSNSTIIEKNYLSILGFSYGFFYTLYMSGVIGSPIVFILLIILKIIIFRNIYKKFNSKSKKLFLNFMVVFKALLWA
jgi:uncharacterized membrane protein